MFRKKKKYKLTQETRPDIYFKNIWVSKASYDIIKAVADMEKTTLKASLEMLIVEGAQLYGNTRTTLEKIKRATAAQTARTAQQEQDDPAVIRFMRRMQDKVFSNKPEEKTDDQVNT